MPPLTPTPTDIVSSITQLKQLMRRYNDGSLVAVDEKYHGIKGYQHVQSYNSNVWNVNHGKQSLNFIENIIVDNKIIKAKVVIIDYCNIQIIFSTPTMGYANFLFLDKENDVYCPQITPTPTPTPTITPTISITPTLTPTPTPSVTPTITPSALPIGAYDSLITSDAPIAYWPLKTVYTLNSENDSSDDVISGNVLTIQPPFQGIQSLSYTTSDINYVSFVSDGFGNYINQIDGTTDIKIMGSKFVTPIPLTTNFTIETWIEPTSFTPSGDGYSTILGTNTADTGPYGLQFDPDGALHWFGANNANILTAAGDIILNNTYHIVVISDIDGNLTIYLNGEATVTGLLSTELFTLQYIGSNGDDAVLGAGAENFVGNMGNVAIYNYPLTIDAVTAHYNAGTNGYRYPFS